ncbi:zinc ABC transporter substrate-binding protein [Spiribacter roseus]|uniref:zinc ABC transporter substrate-binding protein n=1 Tax=Spiribacter roseus TaxID=1855875 RepID=UPI000F6D1C04|nr:zinc ABC transporter substrate-binding protein [Spiribacter roseus]AUB79132.1 zinc transporter [Spiribacter roseus]KAF0283982.1 zinc transporter [Spiribacter roseus]
MKRRSTSALPRPRAALLGLIFGVIAAPALAAPRVATDVAPVQSLVTQVMDGVAEPSMVIQRGASPHSYSLRPSEAATLENADIVFWVGDELTPWLTGALDNLAGNADSVALLHTEGTLRHGFRDRVLAEAAHDGHESHEGHEGHESHDEHEGHAHEGVDPHAWLDPVNAQHWLGVIADTLARHDPANAERYQANADAARDRIDGLIREVRGELEGVHDEAFIVFHDAYQYYERRFDLNTVGAISLSDARDPGPAHIAEIRDIVAERDVQCVFAEPQFNPAMVDTVLSGTDARTGVLDPLGSEIPADGDYYTTLINQLSERLVTCLSAG